MESFKQVYVRPRVQHILKVQHGKKNGDVKLFMITVVKHRIPRENAKKMLNTMKRQSLGRFEFIKRLFPLDKTWEKSSASSARRPWCFNHLRNAPIVHSKYGDLAAKYVEFALTFWTSLSLARGLWSSKFTAKCCNPEVEQVIILWSSSQQHGNESIFDVIHRRSTLRWLRKNYRRVGWAASRIRWVGGKKWNSQFLRSNLYLSEP